MRAFTWRRLAGFLLAAPLVQSGVAQTAPAPVLTVVDAVSLAMKGNRQVQSTALNVDRARDGTAALRTERLPQFNTYFLGGEALQSISFTIPRGALGVYPATGPIPAEDSKITTPRQFTGLVLAQATQPLTQLWKIHLAVWTSRITESLAQESLRQQRQDTAHAVRQLYYQMAQTQTQIESAEANVKYLSELQAETDRNLAQQTALKGDSLSVKAKLSMQRYQLLTLQDTLQTQRESMNRLLGRDLQEDFKVEAQPLPSPQEIDLAAARKEALDQRSEVRESHLETRKAENEVRRQRADYIPDLSAHFTYLSLPNVSFVPQNVMQAGFMLQWQPFDWGQKHYKTAALKDSVKQASLTEQDASQQVMIDVDTRFRDLARTRALLDATAVSQEAEREKLRVISNRYGQKAALLADVLQQEAAVAQADSEYRKALAAFWDAKANFDRALGRE